MKELSAEPFELKQLVCNHIAKAKLTEDPSKDFDSKATNFFQSTKASLFLAVRNDRLALLSAPDEYTGNRLLRVDEISPRCSIPSNYRLVLNSRPNDVYQVYLEYNVLDREDRWVQVESIEEHFKKNPKVESLLNIMPALQCAVVAFEGQRQIFQTSKSPNLPKGTRLEKDQVCIKLKAVNRGGDLHADADYLPGRLTVLGINQNNRMMLLERHVEKSSRSEIMFEPLRHLIGVGQPSPAFTEMEMEIPDSQNELNDEQRKVAHPLLLKTAMEVAGPPGMMMHVSFHFIGIMQLIIMSFTSASQAQVKQKLL